MPKKILKTGLWIIAGFVTVFLLSVWDDVYGWAPIPYIRGNLEARKDVAHGRHRELGYGLPTPWRPRYEALLRERYGVEFKAYSGCIVWKSLEDYVSAYNDVSVAAAKRRYGRGIFKQVSNEAENDWKRQHESSSKR